MTPALSVIIPVYNTNQYLSRCMESILGQSYQDFELLLIDDGSTDGCSEICDAYAERDSRIRVIHKENGGVSSARNVGIQVATGEWVLFVDSDDLLPSCALEVLLSQVSGDVDMVYGAIRKFDEKDDNVETIVVDQKRVLTVEDTLDAFVVSEQQKGDWHRYMINRIYRMSIIKQFGLRFKTDVFYKEDGLFVVQYLCRCEKTVVCIPDIVYLYRQVSNSAMGSLATSYNDKLITNIDAHGFILKELEDRGVRKDLLERERRHLFQNYYWIMEIMENTNSNSFRNRTLLKERMIKNVGFFRYLNNLVIPRYYSKVKKFLSI